MNFRVQVAGILDEAEARMLLAAGVDDLAFPVGPGVVTPDLAEAQVRELLQRLPPTTSAVWITYLGDAASLMAGSRTLGVSKIQLHGNISLSSVRQLRTLAPELYLLKSLIVKSAQVEPLAAELMEFAPYIDCFITDTFDPTTGHRGATGKTHDWMVSKRLVEISPKPVMLAGGLTAENVGQAIAVVRPSAVDVHSGVEGADGRKDPLQVQRFVQSARRAALAGNPAL